MSLHRKPHWPLASSIVLVAFLLSSQLLIVYYQLTSIPRKWLSFALVNVFGVVWTWFQISPWLQWAAETFESKMFGTPLGIVTIPFVYFSILVARPRAHFDLEKLLTVVGIQASCMVVWLFLWAFIELFLGWVWI